LVVGYVGKAHDKRIAGVLLTFPILNGIGMLTGADPLDVAQSIYPLVIFNSLLFYASISLGDTWPAFAPAAPPNRKLLVRLVVWTAIWLAGAVVLTSLHDRQPGAAAFFVIALGVAVPLTIGGWEPSTAPPGERAGHMSNFLSLWSTPDAAR